MTAAYQKMKSMGITDVAVFNAIGMTIRPIDLAYLLELLNFRGMLRKTDGAGGDERWKGTLQNLKAALIAMDLTTKVAEYEMWFSHVTNPRQLKWDTTIPEFAAGFSEMKRNFADQPTMPTTADFEAVAALGGGFLTITQEQYDQCKAAEDEAAAQEAAQVKRNEFLRDVWNPAWNSSFAPFMDSGKELTEADLLKAIDVFKASVESA